MAIPMLYNELIAHYVDDLCEAQTAAVAWWEEIVVGQFIRMGMSRADSEHQARMRWPMGPTSYPRVLAVFRKYFYATIDLNESALSGWEQSDNRIAESERFWGISDDDAESREIMAPRVLLLSSLMEVDSGLGDFIKYLVFLPIGDHVDRQISVGKLQVSGEPIIFHNQQMGASRLLEQGADLCYPGVDTSAVLRIAKFRNEAYARVYEDYKINLKSSRSIAIAWWNALVAKTTETIGDPAKALRENYMLRPAGPASHPAIVATIREYWLLFDEVGNTIAAHDRLPPSAILLAWLIEDGTGLSDILTAMPYWPIGLDENGNWC